MWNTTLVPIQWAKPDDATKMPQLLCVKLEDRKNTSQALRRSRAVIHLTPALTPSVVTSYKLPRQFRSDLCPRPGRYEAAFRSQLEELGEDVHQLAPWLSLDSLLDMYGKALYRNLGTLLLVIHVSRPCCRQTCALLQEYLNPMGMLAKETP